MRTETEGETTLTVVLPAVLRARLTAVADRFGSDLDGVGLQALEEFADRWDAYQEAVDAIDHGTDHRIVLQVESGDLR